MPLVSMDNLSRTTPDPDPRKFRPIALGRCHGQTANDRVWLPLNRTEAENTDPAVVWPRG